MTDCELLPGRFRPAYALGRIVMTESATRSVSLHSIATALIRHARGDWGDIGPEEKAANGRALREGLRILSAYHDRRGVAFWILTEADRSATTVLLPDDY